MFLIIAFALNEAVVVFDRIRELRATHLPPDIKNQVNGSIQLILRRSIYTVTTVLLGAVSLFAFGAEPLQMFSLAIFLGLAWGSFTSIFIAPKIWLTLSKTDLLYRF